MAEEKVATPGFDFSNVGKLISCPDIPAFSEVAAGTTVFVAGTSKVYGPYRLDREIARSGGKITFLAFGLGSSKVGKPLTKAELEVENARKDTDLLAMRAELDAMKADHIRATASFQAAAARGEVTLDKPTPAAKK